MVDVPASVGFIQVKCDAVEALADSGDGDSRPDGIPMNGTVDFESVGIPRSRPYVIADDTIIQLRTIRCKLEDGKLIPPVDGADGSRDPESVLADPHVTLVAPDQEFIDISGWVWKATFMPPAGERWKSFELLFSGVPGEVVNLASSALVSTLPSLVASPRVWHVDVPGGDAPVDWIPSDAVVGDWMFNTTTSDLYVIEP